MVMQTDFGSYDVKFQIDHYIADGSLAVCAWDTEGPVASITTCLNDMSLARDEAYIDTNNCPWAVAFLEQAGLAKLTGAQRTSGYCTYPLAKFDLEALKLETM
jgi:hypothetical protein